MAIERAKAFLKQRGFLDRVIEPTVSTATVSLAAAALGVEEGMIAKTLSFLLGDKPILILTAGTARIDNKKFKAFFHAKARLIELDRIEELVGHAAGGVCPFGIKSGIPVYLDESLKKFSTVYPAAGNDHSAVRLMIDELVPAIGSAEWIDVCKMPDASAEE